MNDVTISGVAEDSASDPLERVARPAGANGEHPSHDPKEKKRRLPGPNAEPPHGEAADETVTDHELDSLA